ncbi:MAG: DUF1257 domain-containing protein [Planctomycetia bacterium]|nr:DUF1257 domain-containing protein [Planctomycetia bacterium]
MSHIVQIQTEIRDPEAVAAACRRLNLPQPVHGTTELYSASATGYAVRLPDWHYPVVCDTSTGQIHYDNYKGHWGKQQELDKFLQAYAVEKARIEARKHGHTVTEQTLGDGSIKVIVQVAGGAA